MPTWTNGDVSGSQTLTDNDHIYPVFFNELREAINDLSLSGLFPTVIVDSSATPSGNLYSSIKSAMTALNSLGGGTCYIKAGNYSITSSEAIVVPANTFIFGDGTETVITRAEAFSPTSTTPLIKLNGDNIKISNLKIDMEANNRDRDTIGFHDCIYGESVNYISIERVYFYDSAYHFIDIEGPDSKYITIKDNYFESESTNWIENGAGRYGIVFHNGVFNSNVEGNFLNGIEGNGIFMEGSTFGIKRVTISNNYLRHVAHVGIFLRESQFCSILGNKVLDSRSGIQAHTNSHHSTITGNTVEYTLGTNNYTNFLIRSNNNSVISGNTSKGNRNGIACFLESGQSASNATIIGNSVSDCSADGITCDGDGGTTPTRVIITGNTVQGCGGVGIMVDKWTHPIISSNSSSGNTGYGINNSGASPVIIANSVYGNTAGQITNSGGGISDHNQIT